MGTTCEIPSVAPVTVGVAAREGQEASRRELGLIGLRQLLGRRSYRRARQPPRWPEPAPPRGAPRADELTDSVPAACRRGPDRVRAATRPARRAPRSARARPTPRSAAGWRASSARFVPGVSGAGPAPTVSAAEAVSATAGIGLAFSGRGAGSVDRGASTPRCRHRRSVGTIQRWAITAPAVPAPKATIATSASFRIRMRQAARRRHRRALDRTPHPLLDVRRFLGVGGVRCSTSTPRWNRGSSPSMSRSRFIAPAPRPRAAS